VNDLERFQDLQIKLVEAGFDTTLRARRERNEAVFSLTGCGQLGCLASARCLVIRKSEK
jgi:hypothetical protein